MRPLQLKTQARRWILYLTGSPIRSGTSVEETVTEGEDCFFCHSCESRNPGFCFRRSARMEGQRKKKKPWILCSKVTAELVEDPRQRGRGEDDRGGEGEDDKRKKRG